MQWFVPGLLVESVMERMQSREEGSVGFIQIRPFVLRHERMRNG